MDKKLEKKILEEIVLLKERVEFLEKEDTDLLEIKEDYFELVKILHNLMNSLSPDTKNKIWDMVYKRFEP